MSALPSQARGKSTIHERGMEIRSVSELPILFCIFIPGFGGGAETHQPHHFFPVPGLDGLNRHFFRKAQDFLGLDDFGRHVEHEIGNDFTGEYTVMGDTANFASRMYMMMPSLRVIMASGQGSIFMGQPWRMGSISSAPKVSWVRNTSQGRLESQFGST